jgi:hypothetical protein
MSGSSGRPGFLALLAARVQPTSLALAPRLSSRFENRNGSTTDPSPEFVPPLRAEPIASAEAPPLALEVAAAPEPTSQPAADAAPPLATQALARSADPAHTPAPATVPPAVGTAVRTASASGTPAEPSLSILPPSFRDAASFPAERAALAARPSARQELRASTGIPVVPRAGPPADPAPRDDDAARSAPMPRKVPSHDPSDSWPLTGPAPLLNLMPGPSSARLETTRRSAGPAGPLIASVAPETVVRIEIGRIEVRATAPARATPPTAASSPSRLEAYLAGERRRP